MNSQRSFCELLVVLLELACQGDRFSYCQELLQLVCLLVAESVKALRGKQITPYLLNKAFLACAPRVQNIPQYMYMYMYMCMPTREILLL